LISDKENVFTVILSEFKEEKHFDDNQFMTQMYVVIKDDDIHFEENQFMTQMYIVIKDNDVRYEYMKNVSNVRCHYR